MKFSIAFSIFSCVFFCQITTFANSEIHFISDDSIKQDNHCVHDYNLRTMQLNRFNAPNAYCNSINIFSDDLFAALTSDLYVSSSFIFRNLKSDRIQLNYKGISLNDDQTTLNGMPLFASYSMLFQMMDQQNQIFDFNNNSSFGSYIYSPNIPESTGNFTLVDYLASSLFSANSATIGHRTKFGQSGPVLNLFVSSSMTPSAYIDATGINDLRYFAELSQRINESNKLSLTVAGNIYHINLNRPSTAEAYELTQNKSYNPMWGYRNGNILNAYFATGQNFSTIMNHELEVNLKTKLSTSFAYISGTDKISQLEYYEYPNPYPDYYRNFPSLYSIYEFIDHYTELWQNDINFSQINWDGLYFANTRNLYNVNDADGIIDNDILGNKARYIIAGQNDIKHEFVLNSEISHNFSAKNKFKTGINLSYDNHNYFKTLDELLWADFHVDYPGDITAWWVNDQNPDNNLLIRNNLIYENEKFGYDFIINELKPKAHAIFSSENDKLSYLIAANIGYNLLQRTGNMQNFKFPNNSLGKSDMRSSLNYRLNVGLRYNLKENMQIAFETFYTSASPCFRDVFFYPEISSEISDLNNYQIASAELKYKLRLEKFKLDFNIYSYNELNRNFNYHYYDEIRAESVFIRTEGLSNSNNGLELGLEYSITDWLSFNFAGTFCDYRYTSRPLLSMEPLYNNYKVLENDTAYINNFYLPLFPQTLIKSGLVFSTNNGWYASINANYLDRIYGEFSFEGRTEYAADQFGVASYVSDEYFAQKKLPSGFTFDFAAGKSISLFDNKTKLHIIMSVKNIFDNRDLMVYSSETHGWDVDDRTWAKDKVAYLAGRTFFLNLRIEL